MMTIHDWLDIVKSLTPSLVAFALVWLTSYLTVGRDRRLHKLELLKTKLAEFYGPMQCMVSELEQRVSIYKELRQAAVELHNEAKNESQDMKLAGHYSQQVKEITKVEQLRYSKEDVSILNKMLELFQAKYWLAEKTTVPHFPQLLKLSETWHLRINGVVGFEVVYKILNEAEILKAFSDELKEQQMRLLKAISKY